MDSDNEIDGVAVCCEEVEVWREGDGEPVLCWEIEAILVWVPVTFEVGDLLFVAEKVWDGERVLELVWVNELVGEFVWVLEEVREVDKDLETVGEWEGDLEGETLFWRELEGLIVGLEESAAALERVADSDGVLVAELEREMEREMETETLKDAEVEIIKVGVGETVVEGEVVIGEDELGKSEGEELNIVLEGVFEREWLKDDEGEWVEVREPVPEGEGVWGGVWLCEGERVKVKLAVTEREAEFDAVIEDVGDLEGRTVWDIESVADLLGVLVGVGDGV